MQISTISSVGVKSTKPQKDENTELNKPEENSSETKPLSYYECVNFKGNELLRLSKSSKRTVERRLSMDIGADALKMVEEFEQQIANSASVISDLINNLNRKVFLKKFYQTIGHPIATTNHSLEMSMIPKYLELAQIKDKYRFSEESIKRITKYFDEYMTESDKTDIVKRLLKIGETNNNPLTETEIINFLDTTTGLTREGQEKVLTFVEYAKEHLHIVPKKLPQNEAEAKRLLLQNDQILNYKSAREFYERQIPDITEHIKHENQTLVNMIASCSDPKLVAEIIRETGINNNLQQSITILEEIAHVIPKKPQFLRMLSDSFYIRELISICNALKTKEEQGGISQIIKKIGKTNYEKYDNIEVRRERIIRDLNLEGKVKLCELEHLPPIRVKILHGNFEGGKKR